ncbi:MAG: GNAT family N-acetyltransferase [Flavobacteriaceae bacterium]|jgi:ribosomal-protein-alanine N-acetyltransferase|nr:GNAT family N-acetyltransferase [Flavobacteriaceae bacterium]RZP05699.1 MAG: GNAT family N-acetyltransferase [Flavobacteriales bacterium]
MEIRKLENNDINQVIKIWTNSFSRNFDKPINPNYLSDPNSVTIVMSEEKIIVGVATLHIIKKLTRILGLIEDVAVNEDYRGLGIGKKLVKELIKIGNEKNCDKIVLSSSEKNSKFYEKIGFQKNELQMVIRN